MFYFCIVWRCVLGHTWIGKTSISTLFHVFWIFSETAWRRMNCRQAAHVVTSSFLGLRIIRLAAGSDLSGAILLLLFFFSLGWLVSDVVFGLNSYCTYINCMMNYCLQWLNWWKLHELENCMNINWWVD